VTGFALGQTPDSNQGITIQAALRLFDDTGAETPHLGIPHGSFNRTILEKLRYAREALSTRQIAQRLAGEKALDKRQMGLLVDGCGTPFPVCRTSWRRTQGPDDFLASEVRN
jgi:hypothetical protein